MNLLTVLADESYSHQRFSANGKFARVPDVAVPPALDQRESRVATQV
jgi:hypothetical protein